MNQTEHDAAHPGLICINCPERGLAASTARLQEMAYRLRRPLRKRVLGL